MKNIIVGVVLVFFGFSVQAQEVKNRNAKVELQVSGNCEMCKKRIEKAALSVFGVKSSDWHMDNRTLYLIVNEQKTDMITIQKTIANIGHDTGEFKASKEVYESLHSCCQYERK